MSSATSPAARPARRWRSTSAGCSLAGVGFALIALAGAVPLLGALLGFLLARSLALRWRWILTVAEFPLVAPVLFHRRTGSDL